MKNSHLLTPRDWQAQAIIEAAQLSGSEAAAKLVEARRYGMLADEIERLKAMLPDPSHSQSWYQRILSNSAE